MSRLVFVSLVLSACGVPDQTAGLSIEGLAGQTVNGEGGAELVDGVVTLDVTFTAAPAGEHALALHDGICAEGQLGDLFEDLPAIQIAGGAAGFSLSRPTWTLGDSGPADLALKILVFFETGDGGEAWGCGDLVLEDGDEK